MINRVRWLLFFTIGFLTNALMVLLHLAFLPWFWFKVRGSHGTRFMPMRIIDPISIWQKSQVDDLRNGVYLDHPDTHGLMVHAGRLWRNRLDGRLDLNVEILKGAVTPEGSLYRFAPGGHKEPPSGDMLAAFCYGYVLSGVHAPDLLARVANHYIRNCFCLADKDGKLSTRSSNGGLSVVDGEGWPIPKTKYGLAQPMTGPAYISAAALLALAGRECGFRYWLIYGLHWFCCFGWFWYLVPYMYTKTQHWFYSAHVAQMGLHVLGQCMTPKRWAMNWIAEKASLAPGVVQPFVGAMAYWNGALSNEGRDSARAALLSGYRPVWPQHAFTSSEVLEIDDMHGKNLHSMMALSAYQLELIS